MILSNTDLSKLTYNNMKEFLKKVLLDSGEARLNQVSFNKILSLSEMILDVSPVIAHTFIKSCPFLLPFLLRQENIDLELFGRTPFIGLSNNVDSPINLSTSSYHYLCSWIEYGLEIAKSSHNVADLYFHSIPKFLIFCEISNVIKWANLILQINDHITEDEEIAIFFIKSSIEIVKLISFKDLVNYCNIGIKILKDSTTLASRYYSLLPKVLYSLNRIERYRVFQVISHLVKVSPEMVIIFFEKYLDYLLKLNPNIRARVLEYAMSISYDRYEMIVEFFETIVTPILKLSYPDQESIIKHGASIGEVSAEATNAYFKNIAPIINELPHNLLTYWVQSGLSILRLDEKNGIDYFSLNSSESLLKLSNLKESICFDDYQNLFFLYAKALTGKDFSIKRMEEIDRDGILKSGIYPTSDGQSIYLPPLMMNGTTKNENLRYYKVMTAHQVGYVEFGTFDSIFLLIIHYLGSLQNKELALDIFFILEDGRIDKRLKEEYLGLSHDLELIIAESISKRLSPNNLPLQEALIEILLRLSVNLLDEEEEFYSISDHVNYLRKALFGFYDHASSVWDCFIKTLEIYIYLSRLPNIQDYSEVIYGLKHKNNLPYCSCVPVPFRGKLDPDNIFIQLETRSPNKIEFDIKIPMTHEDQKMIMENIKDQLILNILEQNDLFFKGLFITDLDNILTKNSQIDKDNHRNNEENNTYNLNFTRSTNQEGPFFYDEWDYLQRDYRRRWCCLREIIEESEKIDIIDDIYSYYSDLIQKVKVQFQQIRPHVLEIEKGVEWGDEIDLTATIQYMVDRRANKEASEKIFSRRERKVRRIASLFLVDMSASTGDSVSSVFNNSNNLSLSKISKIEKSFTKEKTIIDVEKESIVVLMEALNTLGDEYAIFGFSGYGRHKVNFYKIKDFQDTCSDKIKKRLCGIKPKESTRMGAAIRHAITKFRYLESDQRLLILLSDGYPQDYDYGEDRSSNEYALNDTMMALLEAQREGIRPFCITMDQSGNDYLKKMCDPSSYLVIQDIHSLPEILPNIIEPLMI